MPNSDSIAWLPAPVLSRLRALGSPRAGRLLALLVLAGLLAASLWISTLSNLDSPWTSIRLAPSFALLQGYPLYSLPNHPPWVVAGYSPLYPLAYLPATLGREPVAAVTLATALAHLYLFLPVGLLCAMFCRRLAGVDPGAARAGGARDHDYVLGLIFFGVLVFLAPSLRYVTQMVHVDAPLYGLLLLACWSALRAEEAPGRAGWRWVALAGALAGLAFGCKINVALNLLALGAFVWWSGGWRRAVAFAGSAAAAAGVVYGLAAWQSGAHTMWSSIRAQGNFPWWTVAGMRYSLTGWQYCSSDPHEKWLSACYLLKDYTEKFGGPALAAIILTRWLARRPAGHPGGAVSPARMVGLFLVNALVAVPASIVSVAKYGGDVNGRALVSLPLALAAIFLLLAALRWASRVERLAAHGALLAAAVTLTGVASQAPNRGFSALEESYATVKAHPGRCYFPYDPLAHLLAGDRFRPNMDAGYCYLVAGATLDRAAFRAALPEHLEYVLISPRVLDWGVRELHAMLPEQSARTDRLRLNYFQEWTAPMPPPTAP